MMAEALSVKPCMTKTSGVGVPATYPEGTYRMWSRVIPSCVMVLLALAMVEAATRNSVISERVMMAVVLFYGADAFDGLFVRSGAISWYKLNESFHGSHQRSGHCRC